MQEEEYEKSSVWFMQGINQAELKRMEEETIYVKAGRRGRENEVKQQRKKEREIIKGMGSDRGKRK